MTGYFQIIFEDNLMPTWRVYHIQFNFLLKLKKIRYLKYRNINFYFTRNELEQAGCEFRGIESTVLSIHYRLTRDEQETLGDHNSEEFIGMVYSTVFRALHVLWDKKNWNEEDLLRLKETMRKENYRSIYPLFGPILNISRKYKATAYADYFADFANIFVEFNLGKNKKLQVLLSRATVDNAIIKRFVHNGFWNTKDEFIIQDELKEIEFLINPAAENIEVKTSLFPGANNNLSELEGYLKALAFDTDEKERYRLLGIPQK
jgi:hypothetical protein